MKKRRIKYILVMLILIIGVLTIRLYVNNFLVITQNIQSTQEQTRKLEEQKQFLLNFRLAYLSSPLAVTMMTHQSQLTMPNGRIYTLADPGEKNTTEISTGSQTITGLQSNTGTQLQGRRRYLELKRSINQ